MHGSTECTLAELTGLARLKHKLTTILYRPRLIGLCGTHSERGTLDDSFPSPHGLYAATIARSTDRETHMRVAIYAFTSSSSSLLA